VAVSPRRGVHLPHVETRSQVHRLRSLDTKKPPISGAICLLLPHCMKKLLFLSIALFFSLPSVSFASVVYGDMSGAELQDSLSGGARPVQFNVNCVNFSGSCIIQGIALDADVSGVYTDGSSATITLGGTTFSHTFNAVEVSGRNVIVFTGYKDLTGLGSVNLDTQGFASVGFSSYRIIYGSVAQIVLPSYASSSNGSDLNLGTLNFQLCDTTTCDYVSDTATRIVSVTPSNGTTTATSTTFGFGTTVYTNVADYVDGMEVVIEYHNNYVASQNVVGVYASTMQLTRSLGEYHFPLNGSSQLSFSTTTSMQVVGKYRMTTKITKPRYSFFGFDFGTDTVVSTSTQFTVATSTAYDVFTEQVQNEVALFNPSACSFVGGDFSVCLGQLFIPREFYMKASIEVLKDEVVHIFPIGYFVDFVQILATTSTSTLQLVDAELPSVLAGGGSTLNITLDAHSMDMLWNATSSQFLTTKQSDTRTFFEITNGYWRILMVLLALVYILRRILGVSVIPEGLHDAQGTVYANGKGEYSRGGVRGRKGWGDVIQ